MSLRPSYIFACYTVIAEKKDLKNEDRSTCECSAPFERQGVGPAAPTGSAKAKAPPNPSPSIGGGGFFFQQRSQTSTQGVGGIIGLNSLMNMEVMEDVFHHCPASSKYEPNPDCVYHLECNDPIYRCFDLARMASQGAKHLPQYKKEFDEICTNCRLLSAEILDGCGSEEDVATIFEEKTASKKYFKMHTDFMACPRLRVAIEHNHREFVSQMKSQYYLSKKWYSDTKWQGKMLPYKLVYFILQVVFTPLHIMLVLGTFNARFIKHLNGNSLPSPSSTDSWVKKGFLKYLHYVNGATFNLGKPINRFISLFGFYLMYLQLVISATLRPLSTEQNSTDFEWYHWLILLYSLNALFSYLLLYINLGSLSAFLNIWRIFSILTHFFMVFSLMTNLLMAAYLPCPDNIENFIFLCSPEVLEYRNLLSSASIFSFGFAVSYSFIRMNYYLQLNANFGPIVITTSKIMMDFMSMVVLFILCLLAFSFFFVIVFSSDWYINADKFETLQNGSATLGSILEFLGIEPASPGDVDSNLFDFFFTIVTALFWSVLNPGPYVSQEDARVYISKMDGMRVRYLVFTFGSAAFQVRVLFFFLSCRHCDSRWFPILHTSFPSDHRCHRAPEFADRADELHGAEGTGGEGVVLEVCASK